MTAQSNTHHPRTREPETLHVLWIDDNTVHLSIGTLRVATLNAPDTGGPLGLAAAVFAAESVASALHADITTERAER